MGENCMSQVGQLTDVVTQMVEDGVEFFLNSLLEPTVHVPEDAFQQDWPADSQRMQDLLTSVNYEITKGGVLKSSEREFLLAHIREECRKGGRRFTEVEGPETEKDVIVQGILCLMNERELFDDKTGVLLSQLRYVQKEGRISYSEEVPVFTNVFSRRLGRLIPTLRGYGVNVQLRHEECGSYCRLHRLPSFQTEPDVRLTQPKAPDELNEDASAISSGANPRKGKDLAMADDTDGEIRYDNPDAKVKLSQPVQEGEADEDGEKERTVEPAADDTAQEDEEGGVK